MDKPTSTFYDHSSGRRVNTDALVIQALRDEYPKQHITTVSQITCDLLQYASSGGATAMPVDEFKNTTSTSLKWRDYLPPARRIDGDNGVLDDRIQFGKYLYSWQGHEFVLYVISGRDGQSYPQLCTIVNQYIIGTETIVDNLILAAGLYTTTLHDQIWVFDRGSWQKDRILWESIQKSRWEDVILDEDVKESLIKDVHRFFDSRDVYEKLRVTWKRGIIFYGPPGNGKTVSVKATMHMLYGRKPPIPTLYVKTLAAFVPPEFCLGLIFGKARQEAPCYLVFEDLDSLVTDAVRSFFLNEVDGLHGNDGILMVGSTNHLERLDPGISKRPSRFDRKIPFPDPDFGQRVKYCQYWQQKLKDNKDVKFPDILCPAIAKITGGFSFAYIQEVFVATLLVIAASEKDNNMPIYSLEEWQLIDGEDAASAMTSGGGSADDDLDKYLLWREIKKQVATLRKEHLFRTDETGRMQMQSRLAAISNCLKKRFTT